MNQTLRNQPKTIDYGTTRVGVLVPSGNPIAEPEIRAILPSEVSALITRLELRGSSEADILGMLAGLEAGAKLLAHANVTLIVFHCTAVSTFAPHLSSEINTRIERATGIPSFATSDAIVAGLKKLKARRVALLTPYIKEVHEREGEFLIEHGFEVAGGAYLDINSNAEMAKLTPDTIESFVLANARTDVDAYLLSCTAIRSAGVIEALERKLKAPVLTSNQAMVWFLLQSCGVSSAVPGFGKIFNHDTSPETDAMSS